LLIFLHTALIRYFDLLYNFGILLIFDNTDILENLPTDEDILRVLDTEIDDLKTGLAEIEEYERQEEAAKYEKFKKSFYSRKYDKYNPFSVEEEKSELPKFVFDLENKERLEMRTQ